MKDCPDCGHGGTNFYDPEAPPQHRQWCPRLQWVGAAVAFGLMGMAEAIRLRVTEYHPHEIPCWTAKQGWGASACCEVCGAYSRCTNK
jgi:hypothetical protein